MACPKCGNIPRFQDKYCNKCGSPLLKCKYCKKDMHHGARFCDSCGYPLRFNLYIALSEQGDYMGGIIASSREDALLAAKGITHSSRYKVIVSSDLAVGYENLIEIMSDDFRLIRNLIDVRKRQMGNNEFSYLSLILFSSFLGTLIFADVIITDFGEVADRSFYSYHYESYDAERNQLITRDDLSKFYGKAITIPFIHGMITEVPLEDLNHFEELMDIAEFK